MNLFYLNVAIDDMGGCFGFNDSQVSISVCIEQGGKEKNVQTILTAPTASTLGLHPTTIGISSTLGTENHRPAAHPRDNLGTIAITCKTSCYLANDSLPVYE